jgi:hypothetical protein
MADHKRFSSTNIESNGVLSERSESERQRFRFPLASLAHGHKKSLHFESMSMVFSSGLIMPPETISLKASSGVISNVTMSRSGTSR